MDIDLDQVKLLLEMVSQTDISELTIEMEDERVTIKKHPASLPSLAHGDSLHAPDLSSSAPIGKPGHVFSASPSPAAPAATTTGDAAEQGNYIAITSPMVGTFYRAPSPSAPTFVEVGDIVKIGQTVCIIEAMKLMNDLPSEVSGRIVKICADNGATVEYGQQLFLVDAKG